MAKEYAHAHTNNPSIASICSLFVTEMIKINWLYSAWNSTILGLSADGHHDIFRQPDSKMTLATAHESDDQSFIITFIVSIDLSLSILSRFAAHTTLAFFGVASRGRSNGMTCLCCWCSPQMTNTQANDKPANNWFDYMLSIK